MKKIKLEFAVYVLAALMSSACGVTPVTPVPISQSGDELLTCAQIDSQLKRNIQDAVEFHEKDNATRAANVVKNVVPPLALFSDFSNEDQIKERSLIDRNEKLTYLAKIKECKE